MRFVLFSVLLLNSLISHGADLTLAKEVQIKSGYLDEKRNLYIKLPPKYDETLATYPVLYVLHGQWDMLSTLSVLDLLEDQIPNFIVIGIESRGQELSPDAGKPTAFSKFLSKELVPYISNNYRVAPYSILTGHSNSGRFVLDYWLHNSNSFSTYFAFSPSLDDGYILEQIEGVNRQELNVKSPIVITMANEGEHMQLPFTTLRNKLAEVGAFSFLFTTFPEQSHRTTKHSSLQFALQSIFKGWEPTYELKISGLNALRKHYADLSEKFGFKVIVPSDTLQRLTAHYAISEGESAKTELRKYITFTKGQTAGGLDSLFEIGKYLASNGYQKGGDTIFKEICDQTQDDKRCR